MVETREIVTAVGTLACAVGIGFFMQSGDDAQQRYGGTEEVVVNATSFMAVNPFEPALNVKFLCAAQTQCVARQAKPQRLLIWTVFSSTLTLLARR